MINKFMLLDTVVDYNYEKEFLEELMLEQVEGILINQRNGTLPINGIQFSACSRKEILNKSNQASKYQRYFT